MLHSSARRFVSYLFSPEVVIPVVLAALGIAFTVALAPTVRNVRLAHWFFAIAAVWAFGGVLQWLADGDIQMKYVLSFIICGLIGTSWLASYSWVEGNHAEQSKEENKKPPATAAQTPPPQNSANSAVPPESGFTFSGDTQFIGNGVAIQTTTGRKFNFLGHTVFKGNGIAILELPGVNAGDQQANSAVVDGLVEKYKMSHRGQLPSIDWINKRLKDKGKNFRVSGK